MDVRPAAESFLDLWLSSVGQSPVEYQEQFGQTTESMEFFLEQLDAQYLMVSNWPLGDLLLIGVPSLITRLSVTQLPFDYQPPVVVVHSVLGVLGFAIALPLSWSLMGVVYRGLVAQQVRDQHLSLLVLLKKIPFYWLNLLGFVLALMILAIVIMMPFMIVGTVVAFISIDIAIFILLTGLLMVMWICMFGIFTGHGVLLSEQWVLRAMWDSVRMVRRNFSSATMLWLLIIVLHLGLVTLFAWAGVTTDTWYVLLAVGVYAFVNTGLMAASFAYYNDQQRYRREMRSLIISMAKQHNPE